MKNISNWVRTGVAALITFTMLGAPQLAEARDKCDKRNNGKSYYSNSRHNREYRSGYVNNSYRANTSRDSRYYNNGRSYDNGRYYDNRDYRTGRSTGDSAAIIGGSAAAGAVVGGLLGGDVKGALIGAGIGGAGGVVYDQVTNNRNRRR